MNWYSYTFLFFISLFCSCKAPSQQNKLVDDIITSLEASETKYFNFIYTRENPLIREEISLQGISTLKKNKQRYVSNAYFKLNENTSLTYLQLIADGDTILHQVKSNIFTEPAVLQLRDSIYSPLMIDPEWLHRLLDQSNNIVLIDNADKEQVSINITTKEKNVSLVWLKKEQSIASLSVEVLHDNEIAEIHRWKFSRLTQGNYQFLATDKAEEIKRQPENFL